jgi:hypothetical protein
MMECLKRGEEVKSIANFEMWDGLFQQTLMASWL